MSRKLFTVGHSNLSSEDFIALLQKYGVNAITDVRSYPYSNYLPHFNQNLLKFELLKAKISYVFLGEELGARPKDLSCYLKGKAVYQKIAATTKFASRTLQLTYTCKLDINQEINSNGLKKWKGSLINNFQHKLENASITDPEFVKRLESGYRPQNPCLITVSLSLPFRPHENWEGGNPCWKLIAGVIGLS